MKITITQRGKKYTFTYRYTDKSGKKKQQYEAYLSIEEAQKRAKMIEFLHWNNDEAEIAKLAKEYNDSKKAEKENRPPTIASNNNLSKTFNEFIDLWIPRYTRKKKYKANPLKSLKSNIDNHIRPYFGNMIVSEITTADIDEFLDKLSTKLIVKNRKDNKKTRLKGSTQMKIFNILHPALQYAETWGFTEKCPIKRSQAPSYKYEKRNFWLKDDIKDALNKIEDPILHLAVHLAFICSMRPAEVVGLNLKSIDLKNKTIKIYQTIQRVYEKELYETECDYVYSVFPKKNDNSATVLILKTPKNDNSERIGFLNNALFEEIKERIAQIKREKAYYGTDYNDFGLLFCLPNGDPIEPRLMDRRFKKWQRKNGVDENNLLDMQGVRKSATMYKLRLTNYDVQVVGGDGGQSSPSVILEHYDEVLEADRKRLSNLIENDFYNENVEKEIDCEEVAEKMIDLLKQDPNFALKLMSGFAKN